MFTENGRVVYIGDIQTGVSTKTGEGWAMQDIVIETQERFPRKICATITKRAQIDAHNLMLGEQVTMLVEPSAHEFNGRWFPDMRCIDILTNNISRFVIGRIQ